MSPHHLFRPYLAGDLALSNRIVLAPMTRSRAHAGNVPNPLAAEYYAVDRLGREKFPDKSAPGFSEAVVPDAVDRGSAYLPLSRVRRPAGDHRLSCRTRRVARRRAVGDVVVGASRQRPLCPTQGKPPDDPAGAGGANLRRAASLTPRHAR